jgi:hypothetical protein
VSTARSYLVQNIMLSYVTHVATVRREAPARRPSTLLQSASHSPAQLVEAALAAEAHPRTSERFGRFLNKVRNLILGNPFLLDMSYFNPNASPAAAEEGCNPACRRCALSCAVPATNTSSQPAKAN